jgi:acetylornithine deacetylase/succinyl-diaminopimelate desuccinylase-like protein
MSDDRLLDQTIDRQFEESLAQLKRLCAQPSIAAQGTGMQACAEMVAGMLAQRGFEVQLLPTAGAPVVFGERPGVSDRTLLFYNHYDVQPPEPLEPWQTPPFEPSIRDGRLFARGVSDDKGHIICRLAALDALLAVEGQLPCRIKFLVEGEEEIASVHLPEFVRSHADLLAADACLWEFGGVDRDGVPVQYAGLRGICYVELQADSATIDAHSGLGGSIFPNAAWRLVWALASLKSPDEHIRLPGFYDRVLPPTEYDLELLTRLPDYAEEYRQDYGISSFIKGLQGGFELNREEVFTPTCTICGLTSGYQGIGAKTVLPATARAKVDFRLVPDQRPEEVFQQLRAHLDAEEFSDVKTTLIGAEPPGRTDPRHPFIQLVVRTAEPVYGQPQRLAPMTGGSGPNHIFLETLKLPIATAGIGYPGAQVHAPNENIVIEHLRQGIRHTARIVRAFAHET